MTANIHIDECDLHHLLNERAQLREQVTELQERMTHMVESSLARRVRRFTLAIGHSVRHSPTVPPDSEVRLRLRLISEEFFELLDSALDLSGTNLVDTAKECIGAALADHQLRPPIPIRVDLPELADALADLAYVVEGMNACFGINGHLVLDEVHKANMAKVVGGYQDERGKWRKPDGWKPPNVADVLRLQGWHG